MYSSVLKGVDHKDKRLARLIIFSSLLLILNTLVAFWSTFDVNKYVHATPKCDIQIKMQYLFASTLFPGESMVEKSDGNVNLNSTVPLFIWSVTFLSKYSRTLLTKFLWFSRFRVFGDIAFWNKTPYLYFTSVVHLFIFIEW